MTDVKLVWHGDSGDMQIWSARNVIVTSLVLMGYNFNESDIYEPAFWVEWHNSAKKKEKKVML